MGSSKSLRGGMLALAISATLAHAETRHPFDADWRFAKGDPSDVAPSTRPTTNRSATTQAATTTAPADGRIALTYDALKPFMLATGNRFVDAEHRVAPPAATFGGEVSYVRADADDSAWRRLDLPHDWAIEGPFDIAAPGNTGKLPFAGIGWYRKRFALPDDARGQNVYLDVDGAMSRTAVWCNGHLAGGWAYGYASWRVDLTPYLKPDGENVLAIRLENPAESSRWYPGAGLYRHVYLATANAVAVEQWGTQVVASDGTDASAKVEIKTEIVNRSKADVTAIVSTRVYPLARDGTRGEKSVATLTTAGVKIAAGASTVVAPRATIANPKRWSLKSPDRYVAVVTVNVDGKRVDEHKTPFGIRTIAFDADRGFLLNGEVVPINGVCNHHDLGALGAAVNARATERQIEILQSMGCNAIRTSHNPPSPELLDACDRMGMLVMDEAFDAWTIRKVRNGYQTLFDDWSERDWRAQLRRDRNHPSVILWSTGNEVGEQQVPGKFGVSDRLGAIAKEEDPTRLHTVGCDRPDAGFNGFQKTVDVFGLNYKPQLYPRFRETNPQQPVYGSETASTISSRGEYFFPVSDDKAQGKADFQVSSYDLYAPRWAWPPDVEWKGIDSTRGVAGEFVWTGFDYLGEPTPYNSDLTVALNYSDPAERARAEKELAEFGKIRSPARSSYFGIIDLAGFPKDRFYLYQSRWHSDLAMAHVLPHWTWPERVGQVTPVHVYTSGDEAELFLNGKSLGRKKKAQFEYRLRWDDVVYAPGTLSVVAYRNGKEWARDEVVTAGDSAKLIATPDRAAIAADGQDLSFVTVAVQDAAGHAVPRSKPLITFEIDGPGTIVATDNGDATNLEPFAQDHRKAYNGLLLAIVKATPGKPGTITLRAKSDGLTTAETRITTK